MTDKQEQDTAPQSQVNGSEPIAWIAKSRWDQMTAAEPWLTNIVYSEDQNPYFDCVPLYGEPRDRSAYEKGVRDGVEEALQIAADQARLMADLAIEGLPENARSREAMEAALTRFSDNLRVTLEGLSIPGRAALAATSTEDCPTCSGTGKEGRHSICRDCDEPPSPAPKTVE